MKNDSGAPLSDSRVNSVKDMTEPVTSALPGLSTEKPGGGKEEPLWSGVQGHAIPRRKIPAVKAQNLVTATITSTDFIGFKTYARSYISARTFHYMYNDSGDN